MLIIQCKEEESVYIGKAEYKLMLTQDHSCIINRRFSDSSITISYNYGKSYNIPEGKIIFRRKGLYVRFFIESTLLILRNELLGEN